MERLYVIVRADLPPGLQLAQACHAVSAFAAEHRAPFSKWHGGSNNIVVLNVASEAELEQVAIAALGAGVPVAAFREPDVNDELTAIALGDPAKKLVGSLPLALRPAA